MSDYLSNHILVLTKRRPKKSCLQFKPILEEGPVGQHIFIYFPQGSLNGIWTEMLFLIAFRIWPLKCIWSQFHNVNRKPETRLLF